MFRTVLLSLITTAVVAASGAFMYRVFSIKNAEHSHTAAIKECSSKIHTRADGSYIYADFNQCMASKGFLGQL